MSCVAIQSTNVGQDMKGFRDESGAVRCAFLEGEDSARGTGGALLASGFAKKDLKSISAVDSMSVDSTGELQNRAENLQRQDGQKQERN